MPRQHIAAQRRLLVAAVEAHRITEQAGADTDLGRGDGAVHGMTSSCTSRASVQLEVIIGIELYKSSYHVQVIARFCTG
ncbi:hypothetical protein D3C77_708550 [compost metagenome]